MPGLVALVAWRTDLAAVGDQLASCAWPLMLAACLANAASAVLKAVTWRGLLGALVGVGGCLKPLDLVSPLMVGALVNTGLPGRAGEVAKVVLARRRIARRGGRAGVAEVAGSIAAEHLVATLAWALLAAAAVAVLPVPGIVRAATALAGAAALGATVIVVLLPAPAASPGRRLRRAIGDGWRAVHEGLRALRRWPALAAVAAAAAGQWVAQWAAIALTLAAAGIAEAGPAAAVFVLVTVTLSHAVPVMPGGVGLFQVGAMLPLTSVYGVDPAAALAFGILLQLGETVVGAGLGLVFLIRENRAQAQAQRSAATGAGDGSRRIALRKALRSSSVLRASRAGRM